MARSRLAMSPAASRELESVRDAAEYAASHPIPEQAKIILRGYLMHEGHWYVEALLEGDPEPIALYGLALVDIVRNSQLQRIAHLLAERAKECTEQATQTQLGSQTED